MTRRDQIGHRVCLVGFVLAPIWLIYDAITFVMR